MDITFFMDPHQQYEADNVLYGIKDINYMFFGGYEDAERKRLVVCPHYDYNPFFTGITEDDFGLKFLQIEGNFKFRRISHRDILGSLMSLGIKREVLGDIIINEEVLQFIVDEQIADFIRLNLQKINNVGVKVTEIEKDYLKPPQKTLKEINATVASLRLDSVLSAAFGLSRKKASDLVKKEAVKHNWRAASGPDKEVKSGDIISVRNQGKMEVIAVKGKTKKGRIAVVLGRYI